LFRLFRSVGSELQKNKEASRAVQMAAIEGYAELLRNCGHTRSTEYKHGGARNNMPGRHGTDVAAGAARAPALVTGKTGIGRIATSKPNLLIASVGRISSCLGGKHLGK
jgi:hypothetical protein